MDAGQGGEKACCRMLAHRSAVREGFLDDQSCLGPHRREVKAASLYGRWQRVDSVWPSK